METQLKSAPKGRLCISKSHNSFQYYMIEEYKPNKRYYLDKSKRKIAISLAQRDYNKKLLELVKRELNKLDNFIKSYQPQNMTKCYENLPLARKRLITPLIISNSEYALRWQQKEYKHKPQQPDENYLTLKNEKVPT